MRHICQFCQVTHVVHLDKSRSSRAMFCQYISHTLGAGDLQDATAHQK